MTERYRRYEKEMRFRRLQLTRLEEKRKEDAVWDGQEIDQETQERWPTYPLTPETV